jgi:hypothetical protein
MSLSWILVVFVQCEIIKDRVEEQMTNEDHRNRYSYDILKPNIETTLIDLESDTDLLIDLMPSNLC